MMRMDRPAAQTVKLVNRERCRRRSSHGGRDWDWFPSQESPLVGGSNGIG